MASKKTTPGPKTEDLTRSVLPTGGSVQWWKRSELTPRKERPMSILNAHLMPKYKQAVDATGKNPDDLGPLDVGLSREDLDEVYELQELTVLAYLKSWTLKDIPLPQNRDELLEIPLPIYDALIEHASKIQAVNLSDAFSVDAVEDPESPTGDSAA